MTHNPTIGNRDKTDQHLLADAKKVDKIGFSILPKRQLMDDSDSRMILRLFPANFCDHGVGFGLGIVSTRISFSAKPPLPCTSAYTAWDSRDGQHNASVRL
jgi:hypothetical protein